MFQHRLEGEPLSLFWDNLLRAGTWPVRTDGKQDKSVEVHLGVVSLEKRWSIRLGKSLLMWRTFHTLMTQDFIS